MSALLDEQLAGRTVVDLLPNEHRAAWTPSPARYDLIRPELSTPDGKPAGHGGKAAKGLLARALLEDDDVERVLATFDPVASAPDGRTARPRLSLDRGDGSLTSDPRPGGSTPRCC